MATWYWPVPGYSKANTYAGHGLARDIPTGTDRPPVVATRGGKVIDTYTSCNHNYGKSNAKDPQGCGGGYGNRVYIDHGDGYVSRYAHLTDVDVSVGQQVSAGQRIGTVGSTGNSTGNHLHFEIRYNGTKKEPLDYVSPSGPSVVNDISTSSESPESGEGYSSLIQDASGIAVARRVSDTTPQPIHAYVKIYAGDDLKLISTDPPKPNFIQSFEYNRLQNAGETASIVLFDDDWERLEELLSSNWDRINIEYGYYGTNELYTIRRHLLQEYSLDFVSTGVILSISTVTEGIYQNINTLVTLNDVIPASVPRNNATAVVKAICEYMHWEVDPENFDESGTQEGVDFLDDTTAVNPATYILDEIVPFASSNGEDVFYFYIDSTNKAHFKKFAYSEDYSSNMKTYVYQKGYDSAVKDLTFDIKGIFGGTSNFEIATDINGRMIDPLTKVEKSYEATTKSTLTTATGNVQHTKEDQSKAIVSVAGYSPSQMSNMLHYRMKSSTDAQYEATMTIIGDPFIELLEDVRIINITDGGNLHHTSGVYKILGITDTISGGEMTTVLKLVRNASMNIDGIELINPKAVIH